MSVDPEIRAHLFSKLQRHLTRLATKPGPQNVHRFRTYSRRVETLLEDLVTDQSRNQKKLVKLMSRLRRKAGKIRDLDAQIAALQTLKVPQQPVQKSQVARALAEKRIQREKKILKAFDKETVAELRSRIKKAARETEVPDSVDPLAVALRRFSDLGNDHAPLTEKKLHQYRIAGKKIRYLAEFAGSKPEAQEVIRQLKSMQDVIGDWHDWLSLTARAEKMFGGVQDSPLVAMLSNVTRAKFRQALDAVANTRNALLGRKSSDVGALAPRKPAARQRAQAAVA